MLNDKKARNFFVTDHAKQNGGIKNLVENDMHFGREDIHDIEQYYLKVVFRRYAYGATRVIREF